ncbi:alpha/beta hydrolase [Aeromicrobium sp. CTD01-1L150]|uniref:alpha/beta hydrolase n=1 Tax=Aeromicrobium sp. CTD01-1L150 TaxID=3341830 RepID=UPI0035C1A8B2
MSATAPIVPGAEPYVADGGSVGVLLSHGFTGSPASMVPWARALAERGHTVRVPRLPGHGTTWREMNTTRWVDWYGALEREFLQLRDRCETVAVGGLSMGGALALRLAALHPESVDAVVVVNPALAMGDPKLRLVPFLKWIVASTPAIGNDIAKPGQDEKAYPRTPLKALHSMMQLWDDVVPRLGDVTAPLLFLRSPQDHVVDAQTLDLVRAHVGSRVTEYVDLHDSYHVATLDHDAELIMERSAAFIAEHAGAGHG